MIKIFTDKQNQICQATESDVLETITFFFEITATCAMCHSTQLATRCGRKGK